MIELECQIDDQGFIYFRDKIIGRRQRGIDWFYATEDGSMGYHGKVTDFLRSDFEELFKKQFNML